MKNLKFLKKLIRREDSEDFIIKKILFYIIRELKSQSHYSFLYKSLIPIFLISAKFRKYDRLDDLKKHRGTKLNYEVDTETALDYFNLYINENKGYRAKIAEEYGRQDVAINDNGFIEKKVYIILDFQIK